VWGPNPTAFSILGFEHGRLGQSSLPVGMLEAKSSEAKKDWARGVCPGASFGPPLPRDLCQIISNSKDCALTRARIGPLCPETYARSFPRVGIVRFAQLHSPQVINRNLSKNDWDKQGGRKFWIRSQAAGRRVAARRGTTFCDL